MSISEEAARWLVRLEENPGADARAQFVAWLKHSPRHLEELMLVDAAYGRLDGIDSQRRIDIQRLLAQNGADVVPLHADTPQAHSPVKKFRWATAAAVALVTLAAAVVMLRVTHVDDGAYVTRVGEQRSVRLSDGSVVHLNTHSRLETDFSDNARNLRLVEGEAYFAVAQDPTRPFRVAVSSAVVQAVGTAFNIQRGSDTTVVAVIEGRVKISTGSREQTATPLAAGEEAKVIQDRIVKQIAVNPARTLAWRQRQLVFSSDTLAEVVEQVNRYNRVQLEIDDPLIAARRLSGIFNVDDLDSLLSFLGREGDLSFDYTDGGNRIVVRTRGR